jgi:hypothetical protein
MQSRRAIVSSQNAVAIPVQIEFDQFHRLYVIINYQNCFTGHAALLNIQAALML